MTRSASGCLCMGTSRTVALTACNASRSAARVSGRATELISGRLRIDDQFASQSCAMGERSPRSNMTVMMLAVSESSRCSAIERRMFDRYGLQGVLAWSLDNSADKARRNGVGASPGRASGTMNEFPSTFLTKKINQHTGICLFIRATYLRGLM